MNNENTTIQIVEMERTCFRCKSQIPDPKWAFCPYCGFCLAGNLSIREFITALPGEVIYEHALNGQVLLKDGHKYLLDNMGPEIKKAIENRMASWEDHNVHISVSLIPVEHGESDLRKLGQLPLRLGDIKKVKKQIEDDVQCPKCNYSNMLHDKVCHQCGTKLYDCVFEDAGDCTAEDNHREPITDGKCEGCEQREPRQ